MLQLSPEKKPKIEVAVVCPDCGDHVVRKYTEDYLKQVLEPNGMKRVCPRCTGKRGAAACIDKARKKVEEGPYLDDRGYAFVLVNGKVVAEHTAVMEKTLGRSLLPGENVHHLNGQRADNRTENLELWCHYHPAGQRARDLLEWAEHIIAQYAPEPRPRYLCVG